MTMSESQENNHRDQIDRYVNEEMADVERVQFEQRMREHAELAQAVHTHRDVLQGIELYFLRQLKETLILSDQPKRAGLPLWAKIAIGLVVAGLLVALAFYLNVF
jgi:outer membrane scaffolding protein for murein synthesis (MipA/OmpV family)